MKVNTDGVLLGAAVSLGGDTVKVLDAGTGTGTIALMIAQRLSEQVSSFEITGIDIDGDSASEAEQNFKASPWGASLKAEHTSLSDYCCEELDLIVSNPPYFDDSLTNPDIRKTTARHTSDDGSRMSYRTLADFASEHLSQSGRLSLILPSDRENDLLRYCRGVGLHLERIVRIQTTPAKSAMRIFAEFTRNRKDAPLQERLILQDGGVYTEEYTALVKDFYLWA